MLKARNVVIFWNEDEKGIGEVWVCDMANSIKRKLSKHLQLSTGAISVGWPSEKNNPKAIFEQLSKSGFRSLNDEKQAVLEFSQIELMHGVLMKETDNLKKFESSK